MSDAILEFLFFVGVAVILLDKIIYAIREMNIYNSGSFALVAAFHDMQAKDKQHAMDTVFLAMNNR